MRGSLNQRNREKPQVPASSGQTVEKAVQSQASTGRKSKGTLVAAEAQLLPILLGKSPVGMSGSSPALLLHYAEGT